ncbi:hypothetical protein OG762_25455 [Streptomyces sp. NBC_01136]|nr:hypothetical protein OG762_25455 [Streptomyces sp. NBC_01136]
MARTTLVVRCELRDKGRKSTAFGEAARLSGPDPPGGASGNL